MTGEIVRGRASWAAEITAAWNKTFDGVIETGRGLIGAKAELAHGEFAAMVEADLPFGVSTSRRLMRIAQDGRLLNQAYRPDLPRSWRSLYELTMLGDVQFADAIEAGKITPDLGQVEARALRTAQTLMKVGGDQRILNAKYTSRLPASWFRKLSSANCD